MYRQISIHPDDLDLQQVWRNDTSSDVREYRLCTVTYDLACAPFLAIRTFRQLPTEERSQFPLGATALSRDCYVDNIVTGAQTASDAITIQNELRELCMAGAFPLRKWAANDEKILPPEYRLQRATHSWENDGHPRIEMASGCGSFLVRDSSAHCHQTHKENRPRRNRTAL